MTLTVPLSQPKIVEPPLNLINMLWSVSRYGGRVLLYYVWNRACYILDLSPVLPGYLIVF